MKKNHSLVAFLVAGTESRLRFFTFMTVPLPNGVGLTNTLLPVVFPLRMLSITTLLAFSFGFVSFGLELLDKLKLASTLYKDSKSAKSMLPKTTPNTPRGDGMASSNDTGGLGVGVGVGGLGGDVGVGSAGVAGVGVAVGGTGVVGVGVAVGTGVVGVGVAVGTGVVGVGVAVGTGVVGVGVAVGGTGVVGVGVAVGAGVGVSSISVGDGGTGVGVAKITTGIGTSSHFSQSSFAPTNSALIVATVPNAFATKKTSRTEKDPYRVRFW